jgi:all-trans-retinol 13,14-reductase
MKTAIVIGGGVGGLSSAILLSMNGWKVQVFDRQLRPGGMLARYRRKGVPYETGFHYCGGIQTDQILGRCLAHLGVLDRLEFLPLNPDGFDRLIFPDFEFRVPVGMENYRERLKDAFPHEAGAIDGVVDEMNQAVSDYGINSLSTRPDPKRIVQWESTSLDDVLNRRNVRDPQLRGVLTAEGALYGVPSQQAPFGMHALVLNHFLEGAWHLRGGGDALAGALVGRLKELGGTITQRAMVKRVIVEGRKAVGVEVAKIGEVRADLVVSNVHPRLLIDMLPQGSVRKAYRSRISGQKLGIGHFGVAMEIDGPVRCFDNANVYRIFVRDPNRLFDDVSATSVPFYFAAAPTPTTHPDGRVSHTLVMLCGLSWDRVVSWSESMPGRRPAAYLEFKRSVQDALVERLLNDFPTLRGRISNVHTSSPLSTQFFTGSPEGAMYGHFHSTNQMGAYRPPQFIRVHDLVQVGHAVFTPGVLGATLSAYYGVGRILGMDRLMGELQAVS